MSGAPDAEQGPSSNGSANGASNNEYKDKPTGNPERLSTQEKWMQAITGFSAIWFTLCMNSGILGILLAIFPYPFNGYSQIASVFFVVDIFLFVIFTILMIAKLILRPRALLRSITSSLDELCFWAAPAIAWDTLVALVALQVSNSYWGRHAFTIVAVVFWWFGAAWMFVTGIISFTLIFRNPMATEKTWTPLPMLPAVGAATQATTGGIVVMYSYDISAGLAVPIIITSYFFLGYAILLALLIYGLFFNRLVSHGLPPPAKLPGITILLGPLGQCASALQLLGTAASQNMQFADYNRGTFLQAMPANTLSTLGVFFAFLFLGFAYLLIPVILIFILEAAFKRQLSYTLVWWSTIFPLATINAAWISLSQSMDSPAFRGLAAALYVFLVIDYLINAVFTIKGVIWGPLFFKHRSESP